MKTWVISTLALSVALGCMPVFAKGQEVYTDGKSAAYSQTYCKQHACSQKCTGCMESMKSMNCAKCCK